MADGSRTPPGDNPDPLPDPATLVTLLSDPSPGTARAVRKALLGLGETARPALAAVTGGADPRQRGRARQILLELDQRKATHALRAFLARPDGELLEGLQLIDDLLGEAVHTDAQRQAVTPALAGWAAELRQRCRQQARGQGHERGQAQTLRGGDEPASAGPPPTLFIAGALRRLLASELGFHGQEGDFHHQARVSLARTIEDRSGLPLTLCAVYALVARGAGFEAGLLPFPGQVLLGLGPDSDRVILDPFGGGVLLSDADCERRLRAFRAPRTTLWRKVCADRQMIIRHVRNLAAAMKRHDREPLARRVVRIADEAVWE